MTKPKYRPTMPHPEIVDALASLAEEGATVATPAEVMKAALPHLREFMQTLRTSRGSDQ